MTMLSSLPSTRMGMELSHGSWVPFVIFLEVDAMGELAAGFALERLLTSYQMGTGTEHIYDMMTSVAVPPCFILPQAKDILTADNYSMLAVRCRRKSQMETLLEPKGNITHSHPHNILLGDLC